MQSTSWPVSSPMEGRARHRNGQCKLLVWLAVVVAYSLVDCRAAVIKKREIPPVTSQASLATDDMHDPDISWSAAAATSKPELALATTPATVALNSSQAAITKLVLKPIDDEFAAHHTHHMGGSSSKEYVHNEIAVNETKKAIPALEESAAKNIDHVMHVMEKVTKAAEAAIEEGNKSKQAVDKEENHRTQEILSVKEQKIIAENTLPLTTSTSAPFHEIPSKVTDGPQPEIADKESVKTLEKVQSISSNGINPSMDSQPITEQPIVSDKDFLTIQNPKPIAEASKTPGLVGLQLEDTKGGLLSHLTSKEENALLMQEQLVKPSTHAPFTNVAKDSILNETQNFLEQSQTLAPLNASEMAMPTIALPDLKTFKNSSLMEVMATVAKDSLAKDNSLESNHIAAEKGKIKVLADVEEEQLEPSKSLGIQDGLDRDSFEQKVSNVLPQRTTEAAELTNKGEDKMDYGRAMFRQREEDLENHEMMASSMSTKGTDSPMVSPAMGEKRAKFISDNSTNAQKLNLPSNTEVWSLAAMKQQPWGHNHTQATTPRHQHEETVVTSKDTISTSMSEKALLDWSHIMMSKELASSTMANVEEDNGSMTTPITIKDISTVLRPEMNEYLQQVEILANSSTANSTILSQPSGTADNAEHSPSDKLQQLRTTSEATSAQAENSAAIQSSVAAGEDSADIIKATTEANLNELSLNANQTMHEQENFLHSQEVGSKAQAEHEVVATTPATAIAATAVPPTMAATPVTATTTRTTTTATAGPPATAVDAATPLYVNESWQGATSEAMPAMTATPPATATTAAQLTPRTEPSISSANATTVTLLSTHETGIADASASDTAAVNGRNEIVDEYEKRLNAKGVNKENIASNNLSDKENAEVFATVTTAATTTTEAPLTAHLAITTYRPKNAALEVAGTATSSQRPPEVVDQNGNEIEAKQSINVEGTTAVKDNKIAVSAIDEHLEEQVLATTAPTTTTTTAAAPIPSSSQPTSILATTITTTKQTLESTTSFLPTEGDKIIEAVKGWQPLDTTTPTTTTEAISTPKAIVAVETPTAISHNETQVDIANVPGAETTTTTPGPTPGPTFLPTEIATVNKEPKEFDTLTTIAPPEATTLKETPVVEATTLKTVPAADESSAPTPTKATNNTKIDTNANIDSNINTNTISVNTTTTEASINETATGYPTTTVAPPATTTIPPGIAEEHLPAISGSTMSSQPGGNSTTQQGEETYISLLDDSTTTTTTTTTTTERIASTASEAATTAFPPPLTTAASDTEISHHTEDVYKLLVSSTSAAPATTIGLSTTAATPQPTTPSLASVDHFPTTTTTMLPLPSTTANILTADTSTATMPSLIASVGGGTSVGTGNMYTKNTDSSGETDVNVIIAITVSVIAVIALVLLVGFLYIMRKRQKQTSFSQRCRPVSLDEYTIDNMSVGGSMRKVLRSSKRTYGNLAFDDPSLRHNPMGVHELAKFASEKLRIFEEFRDVPQITAREDEVPQGCEDKNRYANVLPLPETRVILQRLNDDDKTEYINANYVTGPKDPPNYYIACQAPLESTVEDFWRMIWEQQSRVIIQATDLIENGIEKCAEYLPPSVTLDNHSTFGDFQITLQNREVKDKYAISTILLKHMGENVARELTHYWYKWPETGVPVEEAPIIAMLLEARSSLISYAIEQANEDKEKSSTATLRSAEEGAVTANGMNNGAGDGSSPAVTPSKEAASATAANGAGSNGEINGNISMVPLKKTARNQGPLTVHCSPGTGRTGTIIACDIAIRSLETPKRTVDIPQIVFYVRRGRASAVPSKEQYEFIYKVANVYGAKISNPTTYN